MFDSVVGVIYTKDGSGKYISLWIDGSLENIASFIEKCPPSGKVEIIDALDLPILSTMGSFIDKFSSNYAHLRLPLLEILNPMQQGEVEPKPIIFNSEVYEANGKSKEEYIQWVYELTGYRLD